MSIIDVVRPTSTRRSGAGVAVPSGTLHGVTSDNSDATWISFPVSGYGNNWSLRVGSHTPAANYQRHRIRARIRARSNSGLIQENIDLGRGSTDSILTTTALNINTTFAEYIGTWSQDVAFGLSAVGALSDINIGGGFPLTSSGATFLQTAECYVDIDTRLRPTYTPDILDASGVSQVGGTITDTNRPTLVFGSVAYDDLPAFDWSVNVGNGLFVESGAGVPPTSLETSSLANGNYDAVFTVRSTIRGTDPFEHQQTLSFTIDYDIPPPPPPANVTAQYTSDGAIRVCWEDPGGQPWDDDFVYAEVLRSDCVDARNVGLFLPGTQNAYTYAPDSAQLDVIGDIDIAIELTHNSWHPNLSEALVAKYNDTSNQISYALILRADGTLEFVWSTNGTLFTRQSVVSNDAVPFGGSTRAVRVTLDVDNGSGQHVVTFYTASSIAAGWTQLGTSQVGSGTTSIYAGTADLVVGALNGGTTFPLDAVVHRMHVRSGINGVLVADPDFTTVLSDQVQFVDAAGNTWTIAGAAVLQNITETRVAIVENGLTACFTDYTVPIRDDNPTCDDVACTVSYRIRYVGTISTTISAPANIPDGFIVGWPNTAASIPSGWTRVTALDSRFPRGSSATVSGATGGTSTHFHTTPGHTHSIGAHTHTVGGSTGTSNANTTSARFNGASQPQADQPHSHTRPAATGSGGSGTSGSAAPATDSASNLPAYRDVIWIESDGTPSAFTAGMLAFSAEDVSGWADDAASSNRYLRGATAGGNGGAAGGASTHTHTVLAHTHTGISHTHTLASTSLSNPLSTIEAGFGPLQPEWLPRHTHPMSVGSASTGSLDSATGGITSASSNEPLNRRLRVLANLAGGLQTRMIGLYRGDASMLPSTMIRCDGNNGTPDMRGWFARERGADSLNTTGGADTHSHTTVAHGHTIPGHTHTTSVGISTTTSLEAPGSGDLGNSPTTTHTHTSGNTGSTSPSIGTTAAGTTNTVNHVPPYEDVHFVRLEGVSSVTGVAVPQVTVSQSATVSIDAPISTSDRLATEDGIFEICASSSYDLPRAQQRSVPIAGGTPQVSTSRNGRHRSLSFPVDDIDVPAVETLLASSFIWYAPLTETAAWYAPSGWSVRHQAPGIKSVSVTLVQADPPALEDPEDLL